MDCKFETGTVVVQGRDYVYEASYTDDGWDVRFFRETSHGTVDIALYWNEDSVELVIDQFRTDEEAALEYIEKHEQP